MAEADRDLATAQKWRDAAHKFWMTQEERIQSACTHPAAQMVSNPDPEVYSGNFECVRCLKCMSYSEAVALPGGIAPAPKRK